MLVFLGLLSGLFFILGDIPYVLDIIKGKTKPHRLSWLIFLTLDFIYIANQLALGAHNSLWLIFAWTLVTIIIFGLSIKKGVGGFAKLDILCMLGAVAGLVLWYVLKTPLVSLIANLVVASVAYIPTARKAYFSPGTETKISWLTASLAALIAAASVGKWDYKLLAVPVWSFIASFTIFVILAIRSKTVTRGA